MSFKNYYLVINWFLNIINNRLNKEILLITEVDNILIKKLKEKYKNYKLKVFNINEVTSVNNLKELEPNINILLIGNSFMNIQKIQNLDYKILYAEYKNIKTCNYLLGNSNLIFNIKKLISMEYYEIKFDKKINSYLFYIEKKDPIEIINSKNFNYIYNNTLYLFVRAKYRLFKNIEEIQSNRKCYHEIFERHVEKDINYFLQKEILTSRLAIAIYKSSTLDFLATNTKIGNFFSKKFGTKSKTHRSNKETFKAYNLKLFYESAK